MTALGMNRTEYWHFLRKVYGMDALGAWNYIKRVGLPPTISDVRAAISHAKT
jgi:hypothetical protein